MYGARLSALLLVALLGCGVAEATPTTTITPLYPVATLAPDLTMQAGETRFVFFQALVTVDIVSLHVYGDPNPLNAGAEFRWQLFETGADWVPPNNNDDRLFYSGQIGFTDVGGAWYEAEISDSSPLFRSRTLTAGSYYYLSFQVANSLWTLPVVRNVPPEDRPFVTDDGFISVFGASTLATGPSSFSDIPYFAIATCRDFPGGGATDGCFPGHIPEPSTLALLGLGLAGLAAGRLRRVRLRAEKRVGNAEWARASGINTIRGS